MEDVKSGPLRSVATLMRVSLQRTLVMAIVSAAAACVVGLSPAPALAAPSATQTATDRARVERAVERLEAARAREAKLDAQLTESSAELDRIVAEQEAARARLRSRALVMYRSGDTSFISVLLGASTYPEFAARWDLLTRMSRQDAEDLAALAVARTKAARSAKSLMTLQTEQARTVDAVSAEVARARKELASSQAALKAYESRAASKPSSKQAPKAKTDSTQQLRGSGSWKTAVASHYGRNFTGRGASGERIGPYSMIVAHKTLPFGTLVEVEYNGKRAVARVADRGPYTAGRDFDLGPGVVRVLDFSGVHEIRYRIIER